MASHTQKIIVIGAASVALAAAGILPTYVFAAPGSPTQLSTSHRRLKFEHRGTVSAIDGSSITLDTKKGTTYTVDVQNAKIMKAGSTILLSTVAVGDPIAVMGPTQGKTIDARVVFDKPSTRLEHRLTHRGNIVGGTISAISPEGFTLVPKGHPGQSPRPSITVVLDAQTVVTRAGQPVSLSLLGVNSEVIVSGVHQAKSTTLTASKVIIRSRS